MSTATTSSNEKVKFYSAVSPAAVFRFPKLVEPDYGTAQYPKQDGEYNVRLVMSESEANRFRATLNDALLVAKTQAEEKFQKLNPQLRKKFGAPKLRELGNEVFDRKTEEATGEIEFKFATKASGVDVKTGEKWERKVPLFDAKGKPLENVTDIWNGTVGKVSFEAVPYFVNANAEYGLSLRIKAVQVLDLKSPRVGNRDAKGFGFAVEEGYEHKNPTPAPIVANNLDRSGPEFTVDTSVEEVDNVPF